MAEWRGALLEAIECDDAAPRQPLAPAAPAHPGGGSTARAGSPVGMRPGGRWPPSRGWWAAAALAGVLVLVLAVGWLATAAGDRSAIVGPGEIVVGETVRYRARGAAGPVSWTGPGGERVADADLEVRAVVPGRLRVELRVGDDRVVRTVTAVASPIGPAVESPGRARVGEEIELRPLGPAGATAHYWLGPDGTRVDGDVLRLTPQRAGRVSVVLIARGAAGIERGVRHRVEVVS